MPICMTRQGRIDSYLPDLNQGQFGFMGSVFECNSVLFVILLVGRSPRCHDVGAGGTDVGKSVTAV